MEKSGNVLNSQLKSIKILVFFLKSLTFSHLLNKFILATCSTQFTNQIDGDGSTLVL